MIEVHWFANPMNKIILFSAFHISPGKIVQKLDIMYVDAS